MKPGSNMIVANPVFAILDWYFSPNLREICNP